MTRCPATLFFLRHKLRWHQKRDASGCVVVPHALVWDCQRCGRTLGETTLPTQWSDEVAPRPQPDILRFLHPRRR